VAAANMMLSSPLFPWIGFNAGILFLLAVDLLFFRRAGRGMSARTALLSSGAWITVSLACGAGVWIGMGRDSGLQFLTGYLVEYSLSADNIFIFVLIFDYFQVPPSNQPRVLSWGVFGAMVLRGVMIGAGALLLAHFHWILYIFGVFLLVTGCRMLFHRDTEMDIAANPVLRFCRRTLPMAQEDHGTKFAVWENGGLRFTPLALVLIVVEGVDLIFAVDSIPAVFAITQDPFVVYTSNVCAILGLRSLYFLLAGAVPHLRYLKAGLAVVLVFIGGKMLLAFWYAIPNEWALGIVAAILAVAVAASRVPRKKIDPIVPSS
jgi:tellurite resistance protein TerC